MKKTTKQHKNTVFYDFALPAIRTCPQAGICKKYCFGTKAFYKFTEVRAKHDINFVLSKSSSFIKLMNSELKRVQAKNVGKQVYIRIHSTGDFYSELYLKKWLAIAENNKDVIFYCYTKSVSLLNSCREFIPYNFVYRFSYGGKEDYLIHPCDRKAKIFSSLQELHSEEFYNGSDDDWYAAQPNIVNLGLIMK